MSERIITKIFRKLFKRPKHTPTGDETAQLLSSGGQQPKSNETTMVGKNPMNRFKRLFRRRQLPKEATKPELPPSDGENIEEELQMDFEDASPDISSPSPSTHPSGPDMLTKLPEEIHEIIRSHLKDDKLSQACLENALDFRSRVTKPGPDLEHLPPKILEQITSYLPSSSVGCLFMCSWALHLQLGRPATVPLYEPRAKIPSKELSERDKFLLFIEQDLTRECRRVVYCYQCRKLHDPELSRPYVYDHLDISMRRPCINGNLGGITFPQIQYCMNKYRLGMHYQDLTVFDFSKTMYLDGYTHLTNRSAKIINGKLLLRTEHWCLFRYVEAENLLQLPHNIKACQHLQSYVAHDRSFRIQTGAMPASLNSITTQAAGNSVWFRSDVERCKTCATSYQLHAKQCEEQDKQMNLVLVTWKNLGEGKQPWDRVWKSLLDYSSRNIMPAEFVNLEDIDAFEGGQYRAEDHLNEGMRKLLVVKTQLSPTIYGQPLLYQQYL